ncbi:MAG: XRE family transcriptional regulator [Candidatus Babeliales bacterium]|jgi:SOS-response transcriptional repressor LexA
MISTRLRVKELLKERRWTTKVLAEKTGMSESYLTHIKNGTRRWNEDALKKLAAAFELLPTQLLEQLGDASLNGQPNQSNEAVQQAKGLNLKLNIVPVLDSIPEQPSENNNRLAHAASAYKGQFVSVLTSVEDKAMFALCLADNSMAPEFINGDYLIVCPSLWTNSGDIVAVEYGATTPQRTIMRVAFKDDLVILESLNHQIAPITLVRGKDQFRILGKVIFRYQRLP